MLVKVYLNNYIMLYFNFFLILVKKGMEVKEIWCKFLDKIIVCLDFFSCFL